MISALLRLPIAFYMTFVVMMISQSSIYGQYRITNYNYSHGLDIFSISDIAEDSLGYIWLGSINGFSRFDGLEFRDVLADSHMPMSSVGAEVSDIKVDSKGRTWISFRDAGITCYDPISKEFLIKEYLPSEGDHFPMRGINEIHFDHFEEKIWINTGLEGVFVMDMNTLESHKVITLDRHYAMLPDEHNPDYIYISDRSGVWHLNTKTLEKEQVIDKALHKIIIKDNFLHGYDWNKSVYRIDLNTRAFINVEKTNQNITRDLLLVGEELWVSDIDGILKINFDDLTVTRPEFVDPQGNVSEITKVVGMKNDHRGNIWIGTNAGLSVIYNEFQNLKCLGDFTDLKFYDIIKSPDKKHYYAVSFYGNTVFQVDLNNDKIKKVDFIGSSELDGPAKLLERNNEIWVAFKDGIALITKDNKLKHVSHAVLDKYLDRRGLTDMTLGMDNSLYIIKSHQKQLFQYNPLDQTCTIIPIEDITGKSTIKNVNSDNHGVWIGTDTGIYHYVYGSNVVRPAKVTNDTSLIFSRGIENISFDADGFLWMLSLRHGLWQCQIDSVTSVLTILNRFTKEDGLATHRAWDMAIFDDNYAVFGAFGGMSIYDKRSKNFQSFRQEQGIPLDEIYVEVIDDKVFVLSLGICYFENLLPFKNSKALRVDIDPLLLEEQINFADNQYLTATQNDISIRYNTVSMTYPRSVTYRHRLGKELPWLESKFNNRMVVFNDLAPGDYHFEIQAKDKNTDWGPTTFITFSIAYPIIQTWWFRTLMIFLALALIFILYKYRVNHLKKIASLKIKMNELEGEALRAQMNPHFIFNSLNSIKSYIINHKQEEAADYLTTFSQLIRIVLENSKKRFVSLSDEINALELYIEIENIRLNDKFETIWTIDETLNTNQVFIPPLSLQPFIENAIWHGFMHKNEKGKLKIKISSQNDRLLITIEDNGVGRQKSAEIEKSFGRKRSFGIAITKERLAFKNKNSMININDITNGSGEISGTIVTIDTPLITSMPTI